MKKLLPFLVITFFLFSCVSGKVENAVPARADGLPAWVGNTFSNPQGYWGGYNKEKGLYSWGEANYPDSKIALNAAELDAKTRLAKELSVSNPAKLTGVHRVDFYKSDDGTVYVLVFISNKNIKASKSN